MRKLVAFIWSLITPISLGRLQRALVQVVQEDMGLDTRPAPPRRETCWSGRAWDTWDTAVSVSSHAQLSWQGTAWPDTARGTPARRVAEEQEREFVSGGCSTMSGAKVVVSGGLWNQETKKGVWRVGRRLIGVDSGLGVS